MRSAMISKICGAAALSLMLSALISCGSASKTSAPILNVYQPSVLTLPPGTVVETEAGRHTAQTREVWHSDRRFRDLEREMLKLTP